MSLIILEGLDRTGKSSVAALFEAKGFEIVHQRAPAKGMTADLYMEEQIQLLSLATHKDIVLDRSYYGELVWPQIYGRESLLSEENLEVLRELEESVGTKRILMHDPNTEAHWQRCVDNKEPLTKVQFVKAGRAFALLVSKYGFERKTLTDYPEIPITVSESVKVVESTPVFKQTAEQAKLETANAINEILGKRIIKQKGPIFDKLEINLRTFLNNELGKILGTKTETPVVNQFTAEEAELLRFFCKRLKENQK